MPSPPSAPPTIDGGSHLTLFVGLTLLVSLALGLILPKVAGAGFLLLGLISMGWLTWHRAWRLSGLHASERLMVLAASLYVAVFTLGWVWHGLDPAGTQAVGRTARLLLILPLFLFLRRVDGLALYWWLGLAIGATVAGAHAWWFLLSGQVGEFEARAGGATNPIYFGGIALLMALMLLPRISESDLGLIHRLLAVIGVCGGVSASLLSGSRGAWIAVVPLLLLYLMIFGHRITAAWRLAIPAVLIGLIALLHTSPQINMDQRMLAVWHELNATIGGRGGEGGVGERLVMWQIAINEIIRQPWLGPGPAAFHEALAAQVAAGRAGEQMLVYRHPHNQFLSALLYAGLPGLFSLLLLFALPWRRFWVIRQSSLDSTVHLAWCGLVAVGMLAIMALSESIFERNIGVVWLTLILGSALGLLASERRRELAGQHARKASLSVIMIVRDEADRIRVCLDAVHGWADEIIILDSGSRDDTVAICRQYTDQVEQTDWPGFGRQKQRALDRASGDWVLSLDADEALDPDLKREIDFTLAQDPPPHQAYTLPWLTHAFGTTLQHGHWARAPLRLFRRECGAFTPVAVHEKVVLKPGCRAGQLQGALHHYSYRSVDHARTKLSRYAALQARERFEAGRRVNWPIIARGRAGWNWLDNYLLRAAFLDGRGGWTMSALSAWYTQEKYLALARLSDASEDHKSA